MLFVYRDERRFLLLYIVVKFLDFGLRIPDWAFYIFLRSKNVEYGLDYFKLLRPLYFLICESCDVYGLFSFLFALNCRSKIDSALALFYGEYLCFS